MKAEKESTNQFLESLGLTRIHNKTTSTKGLVTDAATVQRVHCPTCGSYAERIYQQNSIRTQCSKCDYLLNICIKTGCVKEAYAPSFTPTAISQMV